MTDPLDEIGAGPGSHLQDALAATFFESRECRDHVVLLIARPRDFSEEARSVGQKVCTVSRTAHLALPMIPYRGSQIRIGHARHPLRLECAFILRTAGSDKPSRRA